MRVLLAVIVSAALLWLVLRNLDTEAALARLRQTDPRWVLACFGASLAVLVARGLRFWVLCAKASASQVTATIAAQNFLTRVTPMRLGELSVPYLLQRFGEAPGAMLVGVLLVRLLELWVLVLATLVAALVWFGGGEAGRQIALIGFVLLLSLVLLAFRRLLRLGLRISKWLILRFDLQRFTLVTKLQSELDRAASGSAALSRRQALGLGLGTLAVFVLQLTLYWCLLRACGIDLHALQVIVGSSAAQVTGALPVLTVGSVGTLEAGWTLGFVWVGLGLTEAVLSGVFTQVVTLVFAGLFAGLAWPRLRA